MFWLQVKCSKGSEPGQYNDSHVTTGEHLVWQPRGDQATWLTNPGPSEKDILINKLSTFSDTLMPLRTELLQSVYPVHMLKVCRAACGTTASV